MTERMKLETLVLVNGQFVDVCHDVPDIENALEMYVSEHDEKTLTGVVELYSIVPRHAGHLGSNDDFNVVVNPGTPDLGVVYEREASSDYYVSDTNHTAYSEVDLKDYLAELVKDKRYTLEEVQSFSITRTAEVDITFEDAEEGELEVRLDFSFDGEERLMRYYHAEVTFGGPSEVEVLPQGTTEEAGIAAFTYLTDHALAGLSVEALQVYRAKLVDHLLQVEGRMKELESDAKEVQRTPITLEPGTSIEDVRATIEALDYMD